MWPVLDRSIFSRRIKGQHDPSDFFGRFQADLESFEDASVLHLLPGYVSRDTPNQEEGL